MHFIWPLFALTSWIESESEEGSWKMRCNIVFPWTFVPKSLSNGSCVMVCAPQWSKLSATSLSQVWSFFFTCVTHESVSKPQITLLHMSYKREYVCEFRSTSHCNSTHQRMWTPPPLSYVHEVRWRSPSKDYYCSQVDKQVWRYIRFLIPNI